VCTWYAEEPVPKMNPGGKSPLVIVAAAGHVTARRRRRAQESASILIWIAGPPTVRARSLAGRHARSGWSGGEAS
jgi:hypothetical protein